MAKAEDTGDTPLNVLDTPNISAAKRCS